jgi:hypothetical protein
MTGSRLHKGLLLICSIAASMATPSAAGAAEILFTGYSYQFAQTADGQTGLLSGGIQTVSSESTSLATPTVDHTFTGPAGSVSHIEMMGSAVLTSELEWELKGFALATAESNTSIFTQGARGTVILEIGFFDRFTVGSTSLAAGTPIQFEYVGLLHSTLDFVGTPDCSFNPPISGDGFIDLRITSTGASVGKSVCGGAGPDTQMVSQVINTRVGDELELVNLMRLRVVAVAGSPGDLFQSSTADAANTGRFYINPITPGVTLTSASGALYAAPATTPAPEPGTLGLLALGISAAIAKRRRGLPRP